MKKLLVLLIITSMLICGCASKIEEGKRIDTNSFNDLDDPALQEYLVETVYSGMNAGFTNEDYKIEQIEAVYVSKEYLEELDYNSKSNIYFGFTDEQLYEMFQGKKYIFNVSNDNKTIVEEFKEYNGNYEKMLKNVAIGTGVIIVCVIVSVASNGTAIATIFATSAKTAASFATSSAALTGVMSSAVEYYQTGDIEKSLEKSALDASESFKWGAIVGAVTGGTTEALKQWKGAQNIKTMTPQERGADAEARALKKYGGDGQVSFLNGEEVPTSTPNATRPDIVRNYKKTKEAIEVKSINLDCDVCVDNVIEKLDHQITSRSINMPEDYKQRIVLDVQGRNYTKKQVKEIIKRIKDTCEHSYHDIPVDIMS